MRQRKTPPQENPKVHVLPPPPRRQLAPPPEHLEEPERTLWARALTEYDLPSALQRDLLAEALTHRQTARHCFERVSDQGEQVFNSRFERLEPNKLLQDYRAHTALYVSVLGKLRIVLS
jgi:hypothetical protein